MNENDDRKLDRLLARGRLSRPEKERMLAAVLPAAPRRRRRWLWVSAAAPALAAAGLLLLVWPRSGGHGGFRSKGEAGTPQVAASCAGGCAVGRTLVYRVEGAREPLYLAAWTVDGAGVRTWHFPSASGESLKVTPAATPGAPQLLPRGVRLSAGGTQTLHWALLRKPLPREAVLAGGVDVVAQGELPLIVAP